MMNPIFKKTIFISLLGHLTVFSLFSFSFGNRIPKTEFSSVFFWGALLRHSDLLPRLPKGEGLKSGNVFSSIISSKNMGFKKPNTLALDKKEKQYLLDLNYFLKPSFDLHHSEDKLIFNRSPEWNLVTPKRKESVITFHPAFPYNFLLYFKDRQAVNIELMFSIISDGQTNSIIIKRKISSGNLEADLLSMRYIGHYLFIQQARFLPNNWQKVKIELAPRND